jgi:hypothetical protein
MNSYEIDSTEYDALPFNGLADSSMVIEEQMRLYGIEIPEDSDLLGGNNPNLGVNDSGKVETTTTPATITPGLTDGMDETTRPPMSTASTAGATVGGETSYVYDGPPDTGKTFGDVLSYYNIPTSLTQFVSLAEGVLVGVPEDIQKGEPASKIFGSDARLQGFGALFILIGVLIAIINLLL